MCIPVSNESPMPIKHYKPTSNGRRISSVQSFADVTGKPTVRRLLSPRKVWAGRSATTGRITVRHKGGGERRHLRAVDFARDKFNVPAKVMAIEYDPNRNSRLALLGYADGEKRYIIAETSLKVGDTVMSSKERGPMQPGYRYPLALIPPGLFVHSIELQPGKGGQMVHGAGTAATFMGVEGAYAQLRLPSGEVRLVSRDSMATIGQVSNPDFRLVRWGKAGRSRHRGIRPTVRGKVMNPVDHPHGGGEGRNSIGQRRGPMNIYGKKALGIKTRSPKKASNTLILQRRKSKKQQRES